MSAQTTDSKSLLLLTEDLMEKIDEHRGTMSRAEFVGLCIESCLEMKDNESNDSLAQPNVPVALWIPSTMRLTAAPGMDSQMFLANRASYSEPHRSLIDADLLGEPAEEQEDTATVVMWVLALILFGFVDTLTTILILAKGGMELNPVARLFLSMPGGIWSFTVAKVAVIAVLIFLSQVAFGSLKWVVPAIITLAGTMLAVNNFGVLLRLR